MEKRFKSQEARIELLILSNTSWQLAVGSWQKLNHPITFNDTTVQHALDQSFREFNQLLSMT
jgi:hypothetical protein